MEHENLNPFGTQFEKGRLGNGSVALRGLLVLAPALALGLWLWSQLAPARPPLPVLGQIPEFTLTNQFGRAVGPADLAGAPWIADIIFTRCPGPCARMTRQMRAIQERLPAKVPARFVSLTADPGYDTSAVLEEYAIRFKADSENWHFLTGPKTNLYALATEGLKLAVEENPADPGADLFLHSTRFVVVDKFGRLRAFLDGTEPETVERAVQILTQLRREKSS